MHILNPYRDGGGGGFDADYQAILDEGTSQGDTLPSSAWQTKGNQLVLDLKTAGVWSKLDFLYVFYNDADEDFSRLNWIDPSSFELTGGNIIWTSEQGFTKSGSSGSDTSYNPSTDAINFTTSSASFGFKHGSIGGDPLGAGDYVVECITGAEDINYTVGATLRYRLNTSINITIGSKATYGDPSGTDAFPVYSVDSGNGYYYLNGSLSNTVSASPTNPPNSNVFIGLGAFSNEMQMAFLGTHLTSDEVSDFYDAFDTYLT